MELIELSLESRDGVAVITFNRPQVLNALTRQGFQELRSAVRQVSADPSVRAVIFTGAGRGFSSGVDISGNDFSSNEGRKPNVYPTEDFVLLIHRIEKPTIAAINGVAVGAGFAFAAACDIRIASSEARFCVPFVNLGTPVLDGVGWLLPRIMGVDRALELIYSGDMIDAREAERIGLVTHVTPPDQLLPSAMEMARKFAAKPPFAMTMSKLLVSQATTKTFEDYLVLQNSAALSNRVFLAHDIQEANRARREKRAPRFRGVEG